MNRKTTQKAAFLILILLLLFSLVAFGQESDKDKELKDYPVTQYQPLILKVSPDGSKYVRFILWNQIWAEDHDLKNDPSMGFRIRRARVLAYAQISPRFLVLTHFGLNNLTSAQMDPLGNYQEDTSDGSQLFLHAAWTEFKVSQDKALYLGAGLHYWNGLSRFSSASTLNFMTLDNFRQSWAQLGLSDQFGRHLGVYAKGSLGKVRYSFALNEAIVDALGSDDRENLTEGSITYSGRKILGDEARMVNTAYVEYQFLDQESNKLPYRVGTYMGRKKVFNLGLGYFHHGNGTVSIENGETVAHDVNHWAMDAYYDAPLGKGAVNVYSAFYHFNYGPDYNYMTTYGSGNSVYTQVGYLLPAETKTGRFMPYMAYSINDFEAFQNAGDRLQLGMNWFINGHNAKITVEYRNSQLNYSDDKPGRVHGLIIQSHIFL